MAALELALAGKPLLLKGEPGTGNTEAKIGGDPQFVSNLTVWESVEQLETFVWGTIHKQFYERRRDWFDVLGEMHFVMWWVPVGHRPTLDEALARLYPEPGVDLRPATAALGLAQARAMAAAVGVAGFLCLKLYGMLKGGELGADYGRLPPTTRSTSIGGHPPVGMRS